MRSGFLNRINLSGYWGQSSHPAWVNNTRESAVDILPNRRQGEKTKEVSSTWQHCTNTSYQCRKCPQIRSIKEWGIWGPARSVPPYPKGRAANRAVFLLVELVCEPE